LLSTRCAGAAVADFMLSTIPSTCKRERDNC
jgi:hypothetical protein